MRTIGRHIASILTVLLAVALFHSCAKDEDIETVVGDGEARLSLVFSTGELSLTRAITQVAGVEEYNENVIHRMDVFFYPLAAMGEDQEAKKAVLHLSYNSLDVQSTYEIKNKIVSKGTLNTLGLTSDGAQCYVYVVANAPSTITSFDDYSTIAEVKAQRIEASSFADLDWTKRKQDEFVMTGAGNATYALATTTLSGNIELKRVAAKIEFRVTNVKESITDEGGNVWVSDKENMHIQFNDGVKATNIGGTKTVDKADYFDTTNSSTKGEYITLTNENSTGTSYFHQYPFYSYPSDWTDGTDEEAYATLTVPWARVKNDDDGNPMKDSNGKYVLAGSYLTTYYQIPIGNNAKGIVSNAYYKMGIDVGIIGSFDPNEPVTLEDNSYIIVDWTSGMLLPIAMKKITYLAVEEDEVDMYNVTEREVKFVTSDVDKTTVKVSQVKFTDYYHTSNDDITEVTLAGSESHTYNHGTLSGTTISLNSFTPTIVTKKNGETTETYVKLNCNIDEDKTYVPYQITVEVALNSSSSTTIREQIVFTWYPPIYVVGHRSNGKVYVNGTDRNSGYGGVNTSGVNGQGDNNNRNIYEVHISALPANNPNSDKYTSIGDVRETVAKNITNTYTSYYTTRTDEDVDKMLAPTFIIASSYGKTTSLNSYSNVERRCSTYQEDGYQGGRWRIPTEGEIYFITSLSDKGVIPSLFELNNGQNDSYASSRDGRYFSRNYVRCVYDLWYWGEEHTQYATTYNWGTP